MPECTCYVIYGSTEAEPIAHYEMQLGEESQLKSRDFIDVKIIDLPLEPIPQNQPRGPSTQRGGEVIVSGDHVNKGYIDNEEANVKTRYTTMRASSGIEPATAATSTSTAPSGWSDEPDVVTHQRKRYDPFPWKAPSWRQLHFVKWR